jgi:hypothetical protein
LAHHFFAGCHNHDYRHQGSCHNPVKNCGPEERLDGIYVHEVERQSNQSCYRYGAVEANCLSRFALKARFPSTGLANSIARRRSQHWNRQQAGADDSADKQQERKMTGERFQCLGRLGGGRDFGSSMSVQCRRCGKNDEECDKVGEGAASGSTQFSCRAGWVTGE